MCILICIHDCLEVNHHEDAEQNRHTFLLTFSIELCAAAIFRRRPNYMRPAHECLACAGNFISTKDLGRKFSPQRTRRSHSGGKGKRFAPGKGSRIRPWPLSMMHLNDQKHVHRAGLPCAAHKIDRSLTCQHEFTGLRVFSHLSATQHVVILIQCTRASPAK